MNALTSFSSSSSFVPARASRRVSTRRGLILPCQAVRESDFKLIAERTLDVSVDGLLLPVRGDERVGTGDALIVSFEIPGMWIDAEAIVSRVILGRRPGDDGKACGVLFHTISPAARAALAGHLHGKPPPLPRRGPLARLHHAEEPSRTIAEPPVALLAHAPQPVACLEDVEDVPDQAHEIDPLEILRELASAWKRLVVAPD